MPTLPGHRQTDANAARPQSESADLLQMTSLSPTRPITRAVGLTRSASPVGAVSVLCGLLLCPLTGCGSPKKPSDGPKPAFASTTNAQRRFRELSETWHAALPDQRNRLEPELRQFLEDYPGDDQTRLARAYLAWILIQEDELVEARQLIEGTRRGPLGTARDFSRVVEAALLTLHNQPVEAIRILRPLQGKIIDPVERFLTTEQLVVAALAANLYSEALSYMVDWVEQAGYRARPAIKESVVSRLSRIPPRHLARALDTLEPRADDPDREKNAQRYAHKQWLYEAITSRLASLAVRDGDAALAAKVVDKDPTLAMNPEAIDLVRLATGGETPATIAGRTIGLLLSTSDKAARRRSSEVASGITSALGYAGKTKGSLQLVFAEDTGDPTEALTELSAQGAALLVAGVSRPSAVLAADYAERYRAPVLLLTPTGSDSQYVFTVGVSEQDQAQALSTELNRIAEGEVKSLGLEPTDCAPAFDVSRVFPTAAWKAEAVGGLLLIAEPRCVQVLAAEARQVGLHPWYGLGLEAAGAEAAVRGERVMFLSAGYFPFLGSANAGVGTFRSVFSRDPTWFEALGWDVAQIANEVLSSLPEVRLDEPDQVATYRSEVRAALAGFNSSALWSSKQGRFDDSGTLTRQLTTRQTEASAKTGTRTP
jgi:ABC-type branched-subunit amino acid transport system substrate-binding protein